MAHTLRTNGAVFISDSDIRGADVTIRVKKEGSKKYSEIVVNGDDILEFVASFVRLQKATEMERMSATEVLGLNDKTRY